LSETRDDLLVEGIGEEITATLSRIRDFFVIARQSARTYRGRSIDMREIGRELGVEYALEGTVRRSGDRVRVFVQLIDTDTQIQIWSGRYDRAMDDVFVLQDEIAAQVAGAVHPALLQAEIEAAKRVPPDSLRAYELVLRAYPKLWSAVAEDNREAIRLLEQAIAIDSTYGRAHGLLAWCYSQNVVYIWSADPETDRRRAVAAIAAAVPLAGNDPMTLTALGAALSQCVEDQDRATAYIDQALALDPNNAWAWARAGWIAIYSVQPERAKEFFERALSLSPFDPLEFNFRLGFASAHAHVGDYAVAAALVQKTLDKNPQVIWANRQLAAFAALAGDMRTARDAISKLQAAYPGISIATMRAGYPGRNTPRLFDVFVKGWRLAGLPEE
jgi:TolB-like protein/Tfp pilus assembly protein PilF